MPAKPIYKPRLVYTKDTSRLAFAATRPKRRHWEAKILALLEGDGTALTTRQMAESLGCHPGSLTSAVLALRKAGRIVEVARRNDPGTHQKACYWALAESVRAAARRN